MSIAPTIKYFGRFPTVILMQATGDFDGTTLQAVAPVITPGLYTFAAQAGGGVFNFHEDPIEVKQIAYSGGGTLTVTKVVGVPGTAVQSSVIASITGSGVTVSLSNIFVSPGEYLKFVSSGGTAAKVSVTSQLAAHSSDGAG